MFPRMTRPRASQIRWISTGIIVVSLLVIIRTLPTDRFVNLLVGWVDSLGWAGALAFGAAYVLAALLFVPGAALTLASGAVFGLAVGTAIVSIASTVAAALAFLIARYLARGLVERRLRDHPRYRAIDQAIGTRGWKIIAMLRLSPAIPYSLGNYLFGLTAIRFLPYVLASWTAMLPGTFLYVYLGHVGRLGLMSASGGGASRTWEQWALAIIGLLATIAATIYLTYLARKSIGQSMATERVPQGPRNEAQAAEGSGPSQRLSPQTLVLFTIAVLGAALATYTTVRREAIAAMFGPPAVTMTEAYQENRAGKTFDHDLLDGLLRKDVGEGGWVDYSALRADAGTLDAYLRSLAEVAFDDLGRDETLALLINAYDAFTLRLILDHYHIASIKDLPAAERWDQHRWRIGANVYSLNEIEHREIRARFREPRVHFALVCAAVGCPPLRNEVYTGARLEAQLEDQARYVHRHDRWFRFDPEQNEVFLTRLYAWYGGDFEQAAGSVLTLAARYSAQLEAAVRGEQPPRIEWLDYDWKLNKSQGAHND